MTMKCIIFHQISSNHKIIKIMRPSLKNNHAQRAGPRLVGIEIELKLNINLLREKKKKNTEFTQSIIA